MVYQACYNSALGLHFLFKSVNKSYLFCPAMVPGVVFLYFEPGGWVAYLQEIANVG